MSNNFDIVFRKLYRDIYLNSSKSYIFSLLSFLDYIVSNKENNEIIKNHKYKNNIKKIINKELEKIYILPKIHKYYSEKINLIFNDNYDEE